MFRFFLKLLQQWFAEKVDKMAIASRRKVFANLFWRYMERTFAQLVSFVVSIILARILSPTDFGTVALMNVFISIMQVFGAVGLGSALIQKKDADELDYSTVFWSQLTFCIAAYLIIFFTSPFIASFYNKPELISMTRVSGISILIFGIRNIQLTYVSKNLQFKKFFFATLIGTIVAAIVGIILAYYGAGTWALIAQNLTNLFIDACVLWIIVKWHPVFCFSFERLKHLLGFSINVFLTSLLDTVYNDIRSLVIGKVYSSAELGCYNRGKSFPNLIVSNISTSINSVLFPVMSEAQDDINRVRGITRRSMKMGMFFLAPLMFGLATIAPNLVEVLLTTKWNESIPFVRIFSIAFLFSPINKANLNAIKALGKSELLFLLSVARKTTGIIILLITLRYGVKAIAIGYMVNSVLVQIINALPNKKLLNYNYINQLLDIIPYLIISMIMTVCIFPLSFCEFPKVVILFLQIIIGAVIYISCAKLLKLEAYTYTKKTIEKAILSKKEEKSN